MAENYSFRSAVNGFNRKDVIDFLEKILLEKEEDKKQLSDLQNELAARDEEIAQLKQQIADSEEKCKNCDIAQQYEARLGAAMMDAKRFSENLIEEANDNVYTLYSEASAAAGEVSEKAGVIYNDILSASAKFAESFDTLSAQMKNLIDSVENFRDNIEENYNSDDIDEDGEDDNI